MTVKVNLNGISEIDFPTGVSSATTVNDVTTINLMTAGLITSIDCNDPASGLNGELDCGGNN